MAHILRASAAHSVCKAVEGVVGVEVAAAAAVVSWVVAAAVVTARRVVGTVVEIAVVGVLRTGAVEKYDTLEPFCFCFLHTIPPGIMYTASTYCRS